MLNILQELMFYFNMVRRVLVIRTSLAKNFLFFRRTQITVMKG